MFGSEADVCSRCGRAFLVGCVRTIGGTCDDCKSSTEDCPACKGKYPDNVRCKTCNRRGWVRKPDPIEVFKQEENAKRDAFVAEVAPLLWQGEDPTQFSETDVASELAEDGWPDAGRWLDVFYRLEVRGGYLTERERDSARAYIACGEGFPPDDMRLPPSRRAKSRAKLASRRRR